MRYLSIFATMVVGAFLTLSFQNCARAPNNVSGAGSSGAPATYRQVEASILTPKCVECHHGGLEFGGLNVTSYNRVMQFVVAGDPEQSRLYTRQFRTTTFSLTPEEDRMLSSWIASGAPNN